MKSSKYWAKRAEKRMDYAMLEAQEISNRIGAAYSGALRDIQSQLDNIFKNFADGVSEAEAKRILQRAALDPSQDFMDDLRQAISLVEDPDEKAALLVELNAPAYKARMQRLKALADDAGKKCDELARTSDRALDGGLRRIVRDSYYRGVFDMQQRTGIAFSFAKVSERMIKEILQQNWSGESYSKRIWGNTDELAEQLQQVLMKGVLTGASSGRMANEIQERFHASYSRALTLTRTESSHCANSAELYRYKDTDVESYRYVATLDNRTSEICQELDGKVFPVEDAKTGTNYPPMHPRCRSTTIEELSPELMKKLERRARDPETGELMTVPGDMTYKEWYKQYVDPVNQSREISFLDDSGVPEDAPIQAKDIVDNLKTSSIGKEILGYVDNLPEPIVLNSKIAKRDSSGGKIYGEEVNGRITIYLLNCENAERAARAIIHECTHRRYGIGQSQWAECVCFAQELKHKYKRSTLTFDEKKRIITGVKNGYPEYKWRKGGQIYGRWQSHPKKADGR